MATAHPKRDIDPATPFHEFPGPLLVSTARRFAELGVDESLAAAIRQPQSEAVVRRHLAAIRAELCVQAPQLAMARQEGARQRPRLIHGLYTPPDQQLTNVRTWNEKRRWNIPEDWFEALGPAPDWPTDSQLACVTLEAALPDRPEQKNAEGTVVTPAIPGYIRTVRELWYIISHQHPNASKWDQLYLDAEHLELLEGALYEPGLRWRVLDPGANWDKVDGIRPVDVRNPLTSPNVDGFAALAHHPRYVRSIDGKTIPFLWVPGFVVSVPGYDPRRYVPTACFYRDDRRVCLSASWGGDRDPGCAVPVRRESKRS